MVSNINKYQKRKEEVQLIDRMIIITSIFMLAIIPIVMYKKEFASYTPMLYGNSYATGGKADVFNYYKASLLCIGSFLMLFMFTYKVVFLKQEIKNSKINILIGIFAIVIFLSDVFSKYPNIAFFGNHDRFEGSLAWYCYLIIFFVLFNTKIEEKYYKLYYMAFIPFIVINLIFSVTYLYGNNLLEKDFVNNMLGGDLNGYIITTLYNPNFGSAMSAVVFCISFMYLLLEKDNKLKAFLLISTVASFIMLLCMVSFGGFATILITIPIILVIALRLRGIKNLCIWGGITLVLNSVAYFILNNENERIYGQSFEMIDKINSISKLIIPSAIILFVALTLVTKFINRKKVFDITLIVSVILMGVSFVSACYIVEEKKDEIREVPVYEKLNNLSSGRVDIWIRSMDLINDSILIGNGIDTFPYLMAEKDEEDGLINGSIFIDKPHNLYLTVAYGSGILGLAGFLSIIIIVIRRLFHSLSDKIDDTYLYIFGIGVFAYAVQGLSNDSFVGTSIIFWVICAITCSKIYSKVDNS